MHRPYLSYNQPEGDCFAAEEQPYSIHLPVTRTIEASNASLQDKMSYCWIFDLIAELRCIFILS